MVLLILSSSAFGGRKWMASFGNLGAPSPSGGWIPVGAGGFGMFPDGSYTSAFNPNANVSTDARSGTACLRLQTFAGSPRNQWYTVLSMPAGKFYYQGWYWLAEAGATENHMAGWYNSGGEAIALGALANGKIVFYTNGTPRDTTNVSYENASKSYERVRVYSNMVDTTIVYYGADTLFARGVAITGGTTMITMLRGWITGSTGSPNADLMIDDEIVNDTVGVYQNYWPSDSEHVIDRFGISDNAIMGWLRGDAGNTNLWDAVDNVPPSGNSTETATTNIYNVTSSTVENYDVDLQDYTAAGVPTGATITVIQNYVRHGEHAATGTETGGLQLMDNPGEPSEKSFTFGFDLGAHLTDHETSGSPSYQWRTTLSDPIYGDTANVNIVRGNTSKLRVGRRTANTNKICIDQLGQMVGYDNIATASATKNRRHH